MQPDLSDEPLLPAEVKLITWSLVLGVVLLGLLVWVSDAFFKSATQDVLGVRQAKPGKGGRDVIVISETFRRSPAGT